MNKREKKIVFLTIHVLALFACLFLAKIVFADYASESNAVKTAVGNPPPENNNDVLKWAQIIVDHEEIGSGGGYSRMLADISNNGYSAAKRTDIADGTVGPNGNYWCTYLVVDSYNLAGIKGMSVDALGAVVNMIGFWRSTPGYAYLDFLQGNKIDILHQVRPGYAMLKQTTPGVFGKLDHSAIVKTIDINSHGDGTIVTLNANMPIKEESHTVVAGSIINGYTVASVMGFGTAQGASSGGSGGTNPIIVLDPGHSGSDINTNDPATGLMDHDYPNTPEIQEVFAVAQQVKSALETDGYTVLMTKNSVNENVSLRKRADIASNAHAALAVSIHDDHGQSWNNFAQVYVQGVGLYRETPTGKQITFSDGATAQKSQGYGQIFAQERSAAEGHPAIVTSISFNGRDSIAPGNIPLVELFATAPWVYNEVGADGSGPLSQDKLNSYAKGITNAIEKSIPKTSRQ